MNIFNEFIVKYGKYDLFQCIRNNMELVKETKSIYKEKHAPNINDIRNVEYILFPCNEDNDKHIYLNEIKSNES